MKNREKLNAMSNEEMANVVVFYCKFCPHRFQNCAGEYCKTQFLEWLESEVEE